MPPVSGFVVWGTQEEPGVRGEGQSGACGDTVLDLENPRPNKGDRAGGNTANTHGGPWRHVWLL